MSKHSVYQTYLRQSGSDQYNSLALHDQISAADSILTNSQTLRRSTNLPPFMEPKS
jgi:hypothetical protein